MFSCCVVILYKGTEHVEVRFLLSSQEVQRVEQVGLATTSQVCTTLHSVYYCLCNIVRSDFSTYLFVFILDYYVFIFTRRIIPSPNLY